MRANLEEIRLKRQPAYTKAIFSFFFLVSAARFVLVLNLPLLFLSEAGHDDALYMRLATNLAHGRWLGHFDQFTLLKAPGYSGFLAATAISGLPVSAAHALFQILALAITGWSVWRLTASKLIGGAVFLLLAFYPVGFSADIQRVIHDQIYWAQTLLVVSLFFDRVTDSAARTGIADWRRVRCGIRPRLGLDDTRGKFMVSAGAASACGRSRVHKSLGPCQAGDAGAEYSGRGRDVSGGQCGAHDR